MEGAEAVLRRDPYEVLGVSTDSSDHDIRTAYRTLALRSFSYSSYILLYKYGNYQFFVFLRA